MEDKILCVYSPEDLTTGMAGAQAFELDGYDINADPDKDSAFRLMRNIVLFGASRSK